MITARHRNHQEARLAIMSLEEKQAFFEQLEACKKCDDEEDILGAKEQAMRQKCKKFFDATSRSMSSLPLTKPRSLGSRARTASDSSLKPVKNNLEIIAVTPRYSRSMTTTTMAMSSAVNSSSTSISNAEQQLNEGRIRPVAKAPPAGPLRSQSSLVPPSPVVTSKRKRTVALVMKPRSEQIFKGMSFFYIPNDDVNPARKSKIQKAQEHGVTWARNLTEATHVIVDRGLSYVDIKPFLGDGLMSSSVVFANGDYPIECIRRCLVFDPKVSVEKHRYGIPGSPEPEAEAEAEAEATLSQSSTRDSNQSLQLKSRRDNPAEKNSISQSTDDDTVSIVSSSQAEEIQASKPTAELFGGGLALRANPKPSDKSPTQTSIFTDELVACIDAVLDDPEKHEYLDESSSEAQESESEAPSKKKRKWGQHKSDGEDETGNNDVNYNDKFMCMRTGRKDEKRSGPNADTIKLLEEMIEEHSIWNEMWRVQSYRKAIAALRRQAKKITTAKEAAALPNIGSSLADHVEEIASTGRFQKLEKIREEPSRAALKLFSNIYGVGIPTAMKWVGLGYRTLDDLRSKAKLSTNQRIGLDHYDDLLTRIPRAEVKALGDHVKDAAAAIDPNVELIIGGSYRRGADSSGDIDLIVTKNGTTSTQDLASFLDKLTDTLTAQGFLTAALASHRSDGGNKWHGCCVLPRAAFPGPRGEYRPIWRRIDFLLVPQTEMGAALIYFTGNDLFNRSIRLLARKKGMKLNHRGLTGAGMQEGKDERRIFEILGVQWREPHERWC
ncbi:hypothetical protein GGR50DRAFT_670846 [Xylaria sp. CBS 124048]|nr:hypothetical protein GGR50DRAFT_670846 [Xylaria sp. CBS 124048]